MFTYAHVKWFYGQSERAYYLNYFSKSFLPRTRQHGHQSQFTDIGAYFRDKGYPRQEFFVASVS